MNFDDLRSFGLVVQHGGFTAAERATGERKAKLSRHIQQLESDLETQLLHRSPRSLRMTEAGRAIYEQWQIVARNLEETEAIAIEFRSKVSGNLRISCHPGITRYLGPDFIAGFLTQYPEVHLDIYLTTQDVDLINERFDLTIVVDIDERITHQSLVMRKLDTTRSILVASPDFLARHPDITLTSLSGLPTLSVGDEFLSTGWAGSWKLINHQGQKYTVHHRPRLVSNDSALLRDAVLAGVGIGLLSLKTCDIELKEGTLKQVLPEWHSRNGRISILFTDSKRMPPAGRAFIEYLANAMRKEGLTRGDGFWAPKSPSCNP